MEKGDFWDELLCRLPVFFGLWVTWQIYSQIQFSIPIGNGINHLFFSIPFVLAALVGAAINLLLLYLFVFGYYFLSPKKGSFFSFIALIISMALILGFFWNVYPLWLDIQKGAVTVTFLQSSFVTLTRYMLALSFFVLLMDCVLLIQKKDASSAAYVLVFDFAVAIVALVTYNCDDWIIIRAIPKTFDLAQQSNRDALDTFVVSFKSGAVAFEIILASILFSPRHFLDGSVFGSIINLFGRIFGSSAVGETTKPKPEKPTKTGH